jgi:hypothetical protein
MLTSSVRDTPWKRSRYPIKMLLLIFGAFVSNVRLHISIGRVIHRLKASSGLRFSEAFPTRYSERHVQIEWKAERHADSRTVPVFERALPGEAAEKSGLSIGYSPLHGESQALLRCPNGRLCRQMALFQPKFFIDVDT